VYFLAYIKHNMAEVSDEQLHKFLSKKNMEELKIILRDAGMREDVISRYRRKEYLISLILGNTDARSTAVDLYNKSSAGTGSAQRGPKAYPNRGSSYYKIIYVVVNNEQLRNFFSEENLRRLYSENTLYISVIVNLLDDYKLANSLIVENYDFFIDLFFKKIELLNTMLSKPDILQYYINNPKDRKLLEDDRFKDIISKESISNILRYLNIFPNIYGIILSDINVLDALSLRLNMNLTNVLYNQDVLELFNAYPKLFSDLILSNDDKYNTLLEFYQKLDLMSVIKNNVSLNNILGRNPENMYIVASNINNFTYVITKYSKLLNNILAKPETLLQMVTAASDADIDKMVSELPTPKKQTVRLPPIGTVLPTTSLPTTSLPKTSLPTTSLPTTSLPKTSLPTTSLPTTSLPKTSLSTTSLPKTSLPTTSLPKTSSPLRIPPATPPLSTILESMNIRDIRDITIDDIDNICKQYPVYCTKDGDPNWRPLILQLLSLTNITLDDISKKASVTSYLELLKYLLSIEVTPDQVINAVRSSRELELRYLIAKLSRSEWTEDKLRELDTAIQQSTDPNIVELINSYLSQQE
jgi:hypothetical protein